MTDPKPLDSKTARRQDGKTAIVTSASSGIGRATPHEYFQMIADHGGGSLPAWSMPEAFILLIAQIMGRLSRSTRSRPPLPLDLIKTTTAGFSAVRHQAGRAATRDPLHAPAPDARRSHGRNPKRLSLEQIQRVGIYSKFDVAE
jgi:hypothetical protein